MKFLSGPLLSLCFAWVATPTQYAAEAPPDGLYILDAEGVPTRPVTNQIFRSSLHSQDNGNEKYTLMLHSREPFPDGNEKLALVLAGQAIPINSGGSSGTDDFDLSPTISSEDVVDAAIKKYQPEIFGRHHPGHQILAKFEPTKSRYALGESVSAKLTITNVGNKPFTFGNGGRNRGARNNQFDFTANFQGKMVPDTGNPTHMGGMSGFVTVNPGEKKEIEVDLNRWFKFDQPGTYIMRGNYVMNLYTKLFDSHRLVWEEFVGGEFYVSIVK